MSRPAWDPEVLARIQSLVLRARENVAGFLHGGHASVRVAPNVEFADYKEYSPGDSLRDLDWRVLARSDRLVVRRHQAETELAVTLVVDASADASTGDTGRYPRGGRPPLAGTKWGYAVVLCATLAYWIFRRGEPIGLSVLGGREVRWPWLPPRGGRSHLVQVLGTLAQAVPDGRARLGEGFSALGGRLPRRSMVIVVSDLMEEPSSWGPMVAAMVARRVDMRVVQLYDSREWALDYKEAARFRSPEGGDPLVLDPAGVRKDIDAVVAEYLAEVRGYLGAQRVHHVLAATDRPMDLALATLLRGVG